MHPDPPRTPDIAPADRVPHEYNRRPGIARVACLSCPLAHSYRQLAPWRSRTVCV